MTTKTFDTREELDAWLRKRDIPEDQAEAARREWEKRQKRNRRVRRRT